MNTEQLKYFMEFAFYGTAEKTAAQLGVSRSSVSRNIKKLEEELGSKLFTAGGTGDRSYQRRRPLPEICQKDIKD